MRKYTLLTLFIVFLSSHLAADTFSLSLFQNSTENLFQNIYGESDYLSNLNVYVDKNFSQLSIFTQGNYSYLFKNPSLSYYVHDLGLDYLLPINDKSAFYFSMTGKKTFFRSAFSDYNYFSMNLFAAFKTYLSQTSIVKSNYSLEYKNYASSFFDFVSNALFFSLDKYFPSKTTVKAEVNWGYKYFLHPYISQEIITIEGGQFSNGGRGKGHYSGGMNSQFVIRTEGEGQGIQVLSLTGLIAQGLGDSVGLRLTGMKQWTLSGKNPFTYVEEFYSVENPSYDRFSWEGYQIHSQLAVLVPWNIQIKIGYTIADKEFPGIESLNLDGDSLGITRSDMRKQIEARVEKNFPKFSIYLSYFHINNRSNDLFFEWSGQFFSAGIEWNLFFGEKE
ncbi:MAG: hypothetical protein MUP98_20990 [Candidatus Aminicenantes bacterium]|nr:hypothetical protein [Candidatus Aminicenantes bacterium]